MINVKVKNVAGSAPALSQSVRVGQKTNLMVDPSVFPTRWTRTLAGSLTADRLYAAGTGEIDPDAYVRLLMEYARRKGIWFSVMADEFRSYVKAAALNQTAWLTMAAALVGNTPRNVPANGIARVSFTLIHSKVREIWPSVYDPFTMIQAEYVANLCAQMGWLVEDAPYKYCITRGRTYPDYQALVDSVEAHRLRRMLTDLATADVSLLKADIAAKKALNPASVALQFSYAMTVAYESSKGLPPASAVVTSVLHVLGMMWNPLTPEKAAPSVHVTGAQGMEELRTNLALFLAYQDMVQTQPDHENIFSDEQMRGQIIPMFLESVIQNSQFKMRLLREPIDHIGVNAARDHMGNPAQIVLFEDFDLSNDVVAFVPVRFDKRADRRFLDVDDQVSDRLTSALKPVTSAFSLEKMIEQRISSYEMVASNSRIPKTGAEMSILFPSVYEKEVSAGRPREMLVDYVRKGSFDKKADQGAEDAREAITQSEVRASAFDIYASVVHFAVAHCENTHVACVKGDARDRLVIQWDMLTDLVQPVGASAVLHGHVLSIEPVEVIGYLRMKAASSKLAVKGLMLQEHQDAVHMWDWHNRSSKAEFAARFTANVRNNRYLVDIHDYDMLGTMGQRDRLRFMKPTYAMALLSVWFESFMQEWKFISAQSSRAGSDKISKTAFEGRLMQQALSLVARLSSVSNSAVGARAQQVIMNSIQQEMYDAGIIDDFSELHVGTQKVKMSVWIGLATLSMLGLVSDEEFTTFVDFINSTDAIAMTVGLQGTDFTA